jgi:hypothetical protein
MCWAGWIYGGKIELKVFTSVFKRDWDTSKLIRSCIAIMVLSLGSYLMLERITIQVDHAGRWTGPATILHFFASTIAIPLVICVVVFLRTGNVYAMWVVIISITPYLSQIVLFGRRTPTAELVLCLFIPAILANRLRVPAWVSIAAFVFGFFAFHSIGDYRKQIVDQNRKSRFDFVNVDFSKVSEIDFLGNLQGATKKNHEVQNAIFLIAGTHQSLKLDFGTRHFDELVFKFVPGQLIGSDLKQSLTFNLALPSETFESMHHKKKVGTTLTGPATAFKSFWILGCFVFFGISFVLRQLYELSKSGEILAQAVYCTLLLGGLHAIAHNTMYFTNRATFLVVFLTPVVLYASRKRISN